MILRFYGIKLIDFMFSFGIIDGYLMYCIVFDSDLYFMLLDMLGKVCLYLFLFNILFGFFGL